MRKIIIKSHRVLGNYLYFYYCEDCNRWASWWDSWKWATVDAQNHWDAFHK